MAVFGVHTADLRVQLLVYNWNVAVVVFAIRELYVCAGHAVVSRVVSRSTVRASDHGL